MGEFEPKWVVRCNKAEIPKAEKDFIHSVLRNAKLEEPPELQEARANLVRTIAVDIAKGIGERSSGTIQAVVDLFQAYSGGRSGDKKKHAQSDKCMDLALGEEKAIRNALFKTDKTEIRDFVQNLKNAERVR